MAITHPKPTEETPTNHGEGTTPSPEKATKKHGKMFKAGAAGLAALGIAGAAFVAGRGSGESEPQKVTNDAPVAESTLPSETTETSAKTTDAGPQVMNNEHKQTTRFGQQAEYGFSLSIPGDAQIVEPKLTAEQEKYLQRYTNNFNNYWKPELEKIQQEGGVAYAALGTCLSYVQEYDDGTRVRVFWPNPLTTYDGKYREYAATDRSGFESVSTTKEDGSGALITTRDASDIKIDQVYGFVSNNLAPVKISGNAANTDGARLDTWGDNGFYGTLGGQEFYSGDSIVIGGSIVVIDNDGSASDGDNRLKLCEDFVRNTGGPKG